MLATFSDGQKAVDMLHLYLENNLRVNSSPAPVHSETEDIEFTASSEYEPNYIGPDLLAILQSIYKLQSKGIIAGRNSICKMPECTDLNLTEAKVKNRLKKLESMGYITIGKTKQGVLLTDNGHLTLLHHTQEE